ncbi:MAG: response regulator transcription factor [Clostridiales bacterium]|nr:response regulator transcription factor [Clostridiales bacterium]
MIKVLIVEDEKPIRDLINLHLSEAGYKCETASDGAEGADKIENNKYDLILLDIMMPEVDGYELMEYIRPLEIPVIFITAKHALKDKVKGLRLGADDYLTKPFDMIELLVRIETVLRRYHKTERRAKLFDVEIDFEAHLVTKAGQPVYLTAKEFGLLTLFVKNKNIALFREALYEKVWENEYDTDSRTVDLHVQRLRRKLGWDKILVTVHKVGYRLEAPQ